MPEEAVETEINEKLADEKFVESSNVGGRERCDDVERAKPILQVVELITSLDMIVTFPCAGVQRDYDFSDLYYHLSIYICRARTISSRRWSRGGGGFGRERNLAIEKNVFALFPACTYFFIFFLLSRSFR